MRKRSKRNASPRYAWVVSNLGNRMMTMDSMEALLEAEEVENKQQTPFHVKARLFDSERNVAVGNALMLRTLSPLTNPLG